MARLRWKLKTGAPINDRPAFMNNRLFFRSRDGFLYGVNHRSGKVDWKYAYEDLHDAKQDTAGGLVFICTGNGRFHVVNCESGKLLWGTHTHTPISAGGKYHGGNQWVLFCTFGGRLVAHRMFTGEHLWDANVRVEGVRCFTLSDDLALVGGLDGKLRAFDVDAPNKALWGRDFGAGLISGFETGDGRLYVGDMEGGLHAVSLEDGALLWSHQGLAPYTVAPVLSGEMVLAAGQGGVLVGLDKAEGKVVWEERLSSRCVSRPAVVSEQNKLYVATVDGELRAYDTAKKRLRWKERIGPVRASIAEHEGMVYLASLDGSLYAFGDQARQAKQAVKKEQKPAAVKEKKAKLRPVRSPRRSVSGGFENLMHHGSVHHRGQVAGGGLSRLEGEAWIKKLGGDMFGAPLVVDGIVYTGDSNGKLAAYHLEDGKKLWLKDFTHGIWGTPAIEGDVLYFASYDDKAYAIDRHTGDKLWECKVEGSVFGSVAVHDGVLYCGLSRSGSTLYAISTEDGKIAWKDKVKGEILSSPTVVGEEVMVATSSGEIRGYERCKGALRWTLKLGAFRYTSLAYADGFLYVGDDQSASKPHVYAIDVATQEVVWKKSIDNGCSATAAVGDDRVYFGFGGRTMLCLDRWSGAELWRSEMKVKKPKRDAGTLYSCPVVAGDMVYCGCGDGIVYAFAADSGELLWTYDTGKRIWGDVSVVGDRLLIGNDDKKLHVLQLDVDNLAVPGFAHLAHHGSVHHRGWVAGGGLSRLGGDAWGKKLGGDMFGAPLVSDGIVYVGDSGGKLTAFQLEDGEQLWREDFTHGIWGTPTLEGEVLYFANYDNKAYAVDRHTGKTLWSQGVGGTVFGSVAVDDGVVYLGLSGGGNQLLALSADDGKVIWKKKVGGTVLSSPTVLDEEVIISTANEIYSFERSKGKELWKKKMGTRHASLAYADGVLYFADDTKQKAYALEVATQKVLWETPTKAGCMATAAVSEDRVYIGIGERIIVCLERSSGAEVWRTEMKVKKPKRDAGTLYSCPVVAGGMVYCGCGDGLVYALAADSGELLWTYDTGKRIWGDVSVVGDRLLIGNDGSHLTVLRLDVDGLVKPKGSKVPKGSGSPKGKKAAAPKEKKSEKPFVDPFAGDVVVRMGRANLLRLFQVRLGTLPQVMLGRSEELKKK